MKHSIMRHDEDMYTSDDGKVTSFSESIVREYEEAVKRGKTHSDLLVKIAASIINKAIRKAGIKKGDLVVDMKRRPDTEYRFWIGKWTGKYRLYRLVDFEFKDADTGNGYRERTGVIVDAILSDVMALGHTIWREDGNYWEHFNKKRINVEPDAGNFRKATPEEVKEYEDMHTQPYETQRDEC